MRIKKKSKKVKRCNPIRITKENGKKKMAQKKWPKKNGYGWARTTDLGIMSSAL